MITVSVDNAAQAVAVDASALTVPVVVSLGEGAPATFTYLHIRYADVLPAADSDVRTSPGAYIGTAVTREPMAPTAYGAYNWFRWKGDSGEPGREPRLNPTNLHWEVYDAAAGIWVDTQVIASMLIDENSGKKVREWFGTVDEYNALPVIESDVRYNLLEGKVEL